MQALLSLALLATTAGQGAQAAAQEATLKCREDTHRFSSKISARHYYECKFYSLVHNPTV
jgi:hypothetical protein